MTHFFCDILLEILERFWKHVYWKSNVADHLSFVVELSNVATSETPFWNMLYRVSTVVTCFRTNSWDLKSLTDSLLLGLMSSVMSNDNMSLHSISPGCANWIFVFVFSLISFSSDPCFKFSLQQKVPSENGRSVILSILISRILYDERGAALGGITVFGVDLVEELLEKEPRDSFLAPSGLLDCSLGTGLYI